MNRRMFGLRYRAEYRRAADDRAALCAGTASLATVLPFRLLSSAIFPERVDIAVALTARSTSLGLSPDRLQKLAREIFGGAELVIGEEKLRSMTDSLPGLSQFLWPKSRLARLR